MDLCLAFRKPYVLERTSTIFIVTLLLGFARPSDSCQCRKHNASLTDFGAIGDGTTLNTKAFQTAIASLSELASDGGAVLFVPAGKWLTGSFNLTSKFTLYLRKDAIILGTQDKSEWPIISPLPSYGRGRDGPGGRYCSLLFGTNLTDVIITGDNGSTIDGQGQLWWEEFTKRQLNLTRPYLIELMYSKQIQISNITLLNSPSWNIHPTYCSNVLIQGVTIKAPFTSPNTDGINPDSSKNVKIQDCCIESGDDCIALKSGWDEYGIAFGMPTKHVIIRNVSCTSPSSAVIAIGSEMSGGISDVRAENIWAVNSESGVRVKTATGRGGYVKGIHVKGMNLHTMKYVFWMSARYKDHADDNFDPNALPVIKNISFRDVLAENVTMAGQLEGLKNDTFRDICISNVTIHLAKKPKKLQWNCSYIEGVQSNVTPPAACELLREEYLENGCYYPLGKLKIDNVTLNTSSYMVN